MTLFEQEDLGLEFPPLELVSQGVAIMNPVTSEKKIFDVSYWQGLPYVESPDDSGIDYDKLADASEACGIRSSVDELRDLRLDQNYEELNDRGVPLWFYHYFFPDGDVREQAQYFDSLVAGKNLTYHQFKAVLDVERIVQGMSQIEYADKVRQFFYYSVFADCIYTQDSVGSGDWSLW